MHTASSIWRAEAAVRADTRGGLQRDRGGCRAAGSPLPDSPSAGRCSPASSPACGAGVCVWPVTGESYPLRERETRLVHLKARCLQGSPPLPGPAL